jgi:hypothetical protein
MNNDETVVLLALWALNFTMFTIWHCISGNEMTAIDIKMVFLQSQITDLRDEISRLSQPSEPDQWSVSRLPLKASQTSAQTTSEVRHT